MSRAPQVRLPAADRTLRAIADALITLAHPRLAVTFRRRMGYWPRPALPERLHEKFLWRKLFDRDPRHVELSDKLLAKLHVRKRWPDIRVPAVYWQGADPAEVPEAILAGDCAIKANHGSGMNLFVRAGAVDRARLTVLARRWLRRVYGRRHREWAYRKIPARLFAEQLLVKDGALVSPDYKLYVTGGECVYGFVKFNRHDATVHEAVLDRDGRPHPVLTDSGMTGRAVDRPAHWDRLVEAAEAMGADLDCVRVDLYEIGGEVWFSEFTFYSQAGYCWIDDRELLSQLNRKWDISRSWFLSTPQTGIKGAYARLLRSWLDMSAQTPVGAAPASGAFLPRKNG